MAIKLGRMVIYLEGLLSINSFSALTRYLSRSLDTQKPLYPYYQSFHGHET